MPRASSAGDNSVQAKMRMVLQKVLTLVLIKSVSASNGTALLVRSSIEILKSIGMIPIFLRCSGDSSSAMYPWIEDTPISNLVAKNVCIVTALGRGVTRQRCDPYFWKMVEKFYLKNIVLLVPPWPRDVLRGLQIFITGSYRLPILAVLSTDEQVPVTPMSCSFVWITTTTINVPNDNCLRTGIWRKKQGFSEDVFQVQDKSLYPKNIDIAFSVHGYYGTKMNSYARYPEAVAYMKTLPVLNVTPIWHYSPDIIIEPSTISVRMLRKYDIGAVYTCYGHAFFSSSVTTNTFNVISWSSLTVLVAGQVFVGVFISTAFWLTRNCYPYHSCRTSGVLLFLVGSSFGRSPVPLNVTFFPHRALILLWLFGTLIIGAYVQTQITSEYSVPAYIPTVQTVEDLEALTSSGKILPCVDIFPFGNSLLFSENFPTGTIEKLDRIIMRNFKSTQFDNGGCYSRARDKTHVYIASADFSKRKAAYERGLRPGREFLLTYCSVSLARKGFGYIRQHRRLVLLLAEAGLTRYEERRQTWNHTGESLRTVTFPFSIQFQVFIYGCAGSCFIFLCELLFSKMI